MSGIDYMIPGTNMQIQFTYLRRQYLVRYLYTYLVQRTANFNFTKPLSACRTIALTTVIHPILNTILT